MEVGGLRRKRIMKKSRINKRVKELVDSIQNHDAYKEFFAEIDKDIKRSLEREKKKKPAKGLG